MKKVLALICIGVLFTGVIISGSAVTGKAGDVCIILEDRSHCDRQAPEAGPVCWIDPANEQEDCLNCCSYCMEPGIEKINDKYGCGCCCA